MSADREPDVTLGLTDEMRSALLESLSDGVYFVDRHRRILLWNRGAERITGFSADEVLGRRCKDRILEHCDDAGTILCGKDCPLLDTMCDGRQREAHVFLHHKDGHRKPVRVSAAAIHDAAGEVIGAVETFHDDSALVDSRRRAESLRNASMIDPLTGVGNRRQGDMLLAGWIEQHRHSRWPFGVLFADLDMFKEVNDRYGHQVGDEALRVVTRTLADNVRRGDHVVRWGGEEFLVLLAEADEETLRDTAERLRVLVSRTRLPAERTLVALSISVGGTLAAPGDDVGLIVRRADALLYQSKAEGRDRVTLDLDDPADPAD